MVYGKQIIVSLITFIPATVILIAAGLFGVQPGDTLGATDGHR